MTRSGLPLADRIDASGRRWTIIGGIVILLAWLIPVSGTWPWDVIALYAGMPHTAIAIALPALGGGAAIVAAIRLPFRARAKVTLAIGSVLFVLLGFPFAWLGGLQPLTDDEGLARVTLVTSVVALSVGSRIRYHHTAGRLPRWLAGLGGLGVLAVAGAGAWILTDAYGVYTVAVVFSFTGVALGLCLLAMLASAVLAVLNLREWSRDTDAAGWIGTVTRVVFFVLPPAAWLAFITAPDPEVLVKQILTLYSMGILLAVGLTDLLEHHYTLQQGRFGEAPLARGELLVNDVDDHRPPRSATWDAGAGSDDDDQSIELELPPDDD